MQVCWRLQWLVGVFGPRILATDVMRMDTAKRCHDHEQQSYSNVLASICFFLLQISATRLIPTLNGFTCRFFLFYIYIFLRCANAEIMCTHAPASSYMYNLPSPMDQPDLSPHRGGWIENIFLARTSTF